MDNRGGPWTTKKLAKVRAYVEAYQNVMLNKSWDTVYIDAFCGAGQQKLRGSRDFTEGSALQSIGLARPFTKYHLIEKSEASLETLRLQVELKYPAVARRVTYHAGDVNVLLPQVVAKLDPKKSRAVVFADPYGMQLDWATVEAVAQVQIIDFWLLVPTGLGMPRVAMKNQNRMPVAWAKRLDRFLGDPTWRERWYTKTGQGSLFGEEEDPTRSVTTQAMVADFRSRLETVFPCVAENVLHLKDGNRLLFSMMFACSNPSLPAQAAAKRIANHLLKE